MVCCLIVSLAYLLVVWQCDRHQRIDRELDWLKRPVQGTSKWLVY